MATAFNTMGATPSAPQIGPSSYSSLQAAGMTPQAKALNLSMAGNPNTVQPINVQPSSAITGSASPQGLSVQQPTPAATPHPATAGILSALKNTTGVLAGLPLGNPTDTATGQTPAQMAAANTTGTGAGSADPTGANNNTQSTQSSIQQTTPNQYSSTNTPTYPGLVGQTANSGQNLIQNAQQDSPEVKAARVALQQSYQDEGQAIANIEGSPHTMNFAQGSENVIRNQYLQDQNAKAATLNSAVTTQGQQFTAQGTGGGLIGTAAGLAAPQLAGFNQQSFNPITGQFGNSSSGGTALSQLPTQAQSAIQSYAQQIQSGSMTRADAEGRLSAYGQPGLNALNELLGSGFNTNASNASAGTTAQGQQIQTAAQSTNSALDTLSSAFANLNPLQTAGIPATNSIANWIGQQFGDQALQKFKTNLADARSQLIGVLNSSGGTPTGNEATAQQYLPDNMTKAQFDANVGTAQNPGIVRQLVAQKVSAFTQSGQQTNTNQNASSNLYSF